ncbi:hypothetical protein [Candidatus Clostridium radicumherbarum]|uniref:S1 motif domain-containing protein n=1 Tax=Candidatus Clostridium radicumherbarum TaxID=3381662 RepID=A0ABW8TMI7_9CLOT
MHGIVIEVFSTEAYVSLPDGRNICVGLAHLPSNVKAGSTINFEPSKLQMVNHTIGQIII